MANSVLEPQQKSIEQLAFELYLRTGRILDIAAMRTEAEAKYNHNHDPDNGQFTWTMGHGSGRNTTPPMPQRGAPQPKRPRSLEPVRPNTKPTGPATRHPGFTNEIIAAAQATQRQTGIPASITLAQFALESGYGRSMPTGSNNPFGIKARSGDQYVEAWTHEEDRSGRKILIKAKFKKYGSLTEAFADHVRVLQSPIYAHARASTTSSQFADRLTHVYATDSDYGRKLKSIISRQNLDALNAPLARASGIQVQR